MKKKYVLILLPLMVLGATIYAFSFRKNTFKTSDVNPTQKTQESQTEISAELTRTQKAIDQFISTLEKNPGDDNTRLLLSLAYIQAARLTGEHPYYYPLALKLTDEVINHVTMKDPNLLYEALVSKASIQLSLHNFKGAKLSGERALQIRKDNASVYGVLCDAYVELGQYEEAVKMTDKMISIRPDIRSYSRISYLRELYGDMNGSIEAMKMAVAAGMPGLEQTAWARTILAHLYERNGDLQNAEMQYQISLQEIPSYAFALDGLGRIEARKKNYDLALQYFQKASAALPEFSFHEHIAEVYQLQGKTDSAMIKAREVMAMLAEDTAAGHNSDLEYFNLYAFLLQDLSMAEKFARKEFSRRPENLDACKAMAYVAYKKADGKNAALYIRKATRTNKADAELYCLSGLISCMNGKKEHGLKELQKGLETDPYSYSGIMAEARIYNKQ